MRIHQWLRAGVVDELHVHLAPVLLGAGVRLFDKLSGAEVKLEPGSVQASPRVTHLAFRILRWEGPPSVPQRDAGNASATLRSVGSACAGARDAT